MRKPFVCASSVVLLFAVSCGFGGAHAVATQKYPPGTFSIGGMPVQCLGATTFMASGMTDSAVAYPAVKQILLNDPLFLQLPVPVQLFTYAHECAHIAGHVNEANADCFAAKLGRDQQWFAASDMIFLVQQFAWNTGDWTHAPGPTRLANIESCFKNPP